VAHSRLVAGVVENACPFALPQEPSTAVTVVQEACPSVVVVEDDPLAVCDPLLQVYCCVVVVKVGTVPPFGHSLVVADLVPFTDEVVSV
jgi:hypothetical protein